MKVLSSLTLLLCILSVYTYNRNGAVSYAKKYAHTPNHKCGKDHLACTPCAYFGKEACGYTGHGGDCANFVSQCLVLGGGHSKLNGGLPCRGYPCGFEEPGANNLANCLKKKGWTSSCGYKMAPPSNIQAGDVLVYYAGKDCSGYAHAVLVTVGGSNAKITCHSSVKVDAAYTYMTEKPYYRWLHYNG